MLVILEIFGAILVILEILIFWLFRDFGGILIILVISWVFLYYIVILSLRGYFSHFH